MSNGSRPVFGQENLAVSSRGEAVPKVNVSALQVRYPGSSTPSVAGVDFTVGEAEHVTLLGPSGCGKTTTLRAVAGLEKPSAGEISIGGTTVYSAARRVNVPTERRGVSMVFQSYAIWPHMTVFDNVAYGLRVRKQTDEQVRRNVGRALELVHLSHLAARGSGALSGGQQQRVALARAIAFAPDVILFDEPLSNLDAKLRVEMRQELKALQAEIGNSSLYVTHDQEEALAISDRIIVMSAGVIEQIGTPEEVYNRPRTRFVADFVGAANLIPGTVRSQRSADGHAEFETEAGVVLHCHAATRSAAQRVGQKTHVAVRPAYLRLSKTESVGDVNRFAATIRQRMFLGDFIQYVLAWAGGEMQVRRPVLERLEVGDKVFATIDPGYCVLLES